jgi:hypothetical protein
MKKLLVLVALLLLTANVQALEVAGVSIPETTSIGNHVLKLNGFGIRKKFFVSVYVGSLYTAGPISSLSAALDDPGDKLVRMVFVHKKVGRDKIVEAFAEGFARNTPELSGTREARQFLAFFRNDFFSGDTVDLELGKSGKVEVRHNDRVLGSLESLPLARGIQAIYLGEHPADDDLKKGMLGLNR